jgi:hypothetical protein
MAVVPDILTNIFRAHPMKIRQSGIFLLLIILSLCFSSCSENQPKAQASFFDGMFLEYSLSGGLMFAFEVSVSDDDGYNIIRTAKRKDGRPPLLWREKEEYHVDRYGIVQTSSFHEIDVGRFSRIWIPVHKIEIGDNIDGWKKAIKKERWKDWETLVVQDELIGGLEYYDIKTGLFVGSFISTPLGSGGYLLVYANVDMPVAKEE